jgi:hypothetical protein
LIADCHSLAERRGVVGLASLVADHESQIRICVAQDQLFSGLARLGGFQLDKQGIRYWQHPTG